MNLYYIQAAIKYNLGIKLTLDQLKAYLISEGMCTADKANRYTFKGYGSFFGRVAVYEPVDITKLADDMQGTSDSPLEVHPHG